MRPRPPRSSAAAGTDAGQKQEPGGGLAAQVQRLTVQPQANIPGTSPTRSCAACPSPSSHVSSVAHTRPTPDVQPRRVTMPSSSGLEARAASSASGGRPWALMRGNGGNGGGSGGSTPGTTASFAATMSPPCRQAIAVRWLIQHKVWITASPAPAAAA